jgi:hypothetical protein
VKQLLTLMTLGLALLAMGCGETVIDPEAAEEDIKAGFGARDVTVRSVSCPTDVETEKGGEYECTADTSRGSFRVVYRQLDANGSVGAPRLIRLERDGPGP